VEPAYLSRAELDGLSREARSRLRLRINRNLHAMDEPVHRLLNAIEPGSYVRPHRHLSPPKSETLIVVSGELGLVTFDDEGAVTSAARLSAAGPLYGADLPAGTWHSIVALATGTVFSRPSLAPTVPPGREDVASWSAAEGDPGAERQRSALVEIFSR